MININDFVPSLDELKKQVSVETKEEANERRLKEMFNHIAETLHRSLELGFTYADVELDYNFHKSYGGERLIKDLEKLGYSATIRSYDTSFGEKMPVNIVVHFN